MRPDTLQRLDATTGFPNEPLNLVAQWQGTWAQLARRNRHRFACRQPGPMVCRDRSRDLDRGFALRRAVIANTHLADRARALAVSGRRDRHRARRTIQWGLSVIPDQDSAEQTTKRRAQHEKIRAELLGDLVQSQRSEERRVGKECRSR